MADEPDALRPILKNLKSPIEHDKRLVALLGTITARWSLIEVALSGLLENLLRDGPAARAVYYTTSSFRARVEIVREVARVFYVSELQLERLTTLLSRIYDAFKARNSFVHQPFHAFAEHPDFGSMLTPFLESDFDRTIFELGTFDRRGHFETDEDFRPINRGSLLNHIQKLNRLLNELLIIIRELSDGDIKLRSIGGVRPMLPAESSELPFDS